VAKAGTLLFWFLVRPLKQTGSDEKEIKIRKLIILLSIPVRFLERNEKLKTYQFPFDFLNGMKNTKLIHCRSIYRTD